MKFAEILGKPRIIRGRCGRDCLCHAPGTRTIAVGLDRMLYISVGSTCDACTEISKRSAALRVSLDGTTREIFASGIRNTIGFGWHPQTRELWGIDHGIDWLGDNEQGRSELTRPVGSLRLAIHL